MCSVKNPFEGSISELEHEYYLRRRCAALANLERKRAVSNAVGAIALWLYLVAGAVALKVGGSSKAGKVAKDKAKLLKTPGNRSSTSKVRRA